VVVAGSCTLIEGGVGTRMQRGDHRMIDRENFPYQVRSSSEPTTIVRVNGHWGEFTGLCGVFEMRNSESPRNDGDPVPYPRGTCFDNHFHDCDEYWIVVDGRCVAISEDRLFLLGPGDCLATGMGHHHDIPVVIEPVLAVYFEGTMEGKKRTGHLWEHRDGSADPAPYRV